jgi:hypothetical protein
MKLIPSKFEDIIKRRFFKKSHYFRKKAQNLTRAGEKTAPVFSGRGIYACFHLLDLKKNINNMNEIFAAAA